VVGFNRAPAPHFKKKSSPRSRGDKYTAVPPFAPALARVSKRAHASKNNLVSRARISVVSAYNRVLHNAAIANHPAAMVRLRGAADENGISDLRNARRTAAASVRSGRLASFEIVVLKIELLTLVEPRFRTVSNIAPIISSAFEFAECCVSHLGREMA